MASSSSNVVGVHYRVGKKIGEGSFGVIFEGMNLLNSQQVAIKFVRRRKTITAATTRSKRTGLTCHAGTQEERRSSAARRVSDVQDPGGLP